MVELVVAGLVGNGGGGGKGKDAGRTEPSPPPVSGSGGGGGGSGKAPSSNSVNDDDAPSLVEALDEGIPGPIVDLYIGGFPGGGAPVGFRVGW